MTPALQQLQVDLNDDLERIAGRFKPGARLTLVVRNPHLAGDADVVLTDDDLAAAIGAIQKLQSERLRDAAAAAGKVASPSQLATLEFMREHIAKHGAPPTMREIMRHFALGSTNAVADRVRGLAKKGLVVKTSHGWRPA